jgi:hypothetical protein
VLQQRAQHASPPIQMCDALSRKVPKLTAGVEILLANCLAHYLEFNIIHSDADRTYLGRSNMGFN